jgi:NADH-quinone oxidoreductase subunit L
MVILIPGLPLIGAALMLFFGRKLPRALINAICCGTVGAAFILAAALAFEFRTSGQPFFEYQFATWIPGVGATWGFYIDALSSLMMLIVTGVGFLIHLYSTGYMAHDRGYHRYFGYLNLFVFFMLLLVMSNNYALTFAGWEGVGLASYLLIGFYFDRKSAGDAANKAFLMNRVGDCGYLLAMFILVATVGSLRYVDVFEGANAKWATSVAILLFGAACGKSAQFPLFTWLPDAMEGPTPVSALIHAATMVTAGVYIIARSEAIFALAPTVPPVIAAIGAVTAILAATTAMVQYDIKRVLAYSTVSQLGLMFISLGVGAYWTAVFHLFTHAFFKALLFLGAGAVIHSLDGEQDMRKMGGLKQNLPFAFWTMVIGTLAIAGIPGLAGFMSKDAILWEAFRNSAALWALGLLTSLLTAFYMWRLVRLTFLGEPNHVEAHGLPLSMRIPLFVLAFGSIFAGWVPLTGGGDSHTDYREYILMAMATATALLGIYAAHRRIRLLSPFYFLFRQRWYVDEVLFGLFARGVARGGGRGLTAIDNRVIDGAVDGTGTLARALSRGTMFWDTWIIDGAVRLSGRLVRATAFPARLVQTGSVQAYALMFLAGVAALLGWAITQ